MPHGQSWWSLLPFYANLKNFAKVFGGSDGRTWIAHEPVGMQHVLGLAFITLLITAFAAIAYAKVRHAHTALVPEERFTVRTFIELFVGGVYGMMTDIMGPKAAKFFLPLIGTCAFLIFFSNALGMVPGFVPPTDSMNTTMACAIVIFLSTHIFGVKEHGLAYFKHFFGPITKWYALPLMLLMFVVEMVSHFVRPVSLSIRLAANMAADHIVVSAFLGMIPFLVPVPVMVLGTLVIVVQTVVFCLLSTVYISMAVAHEEH